MAFRDPEELNSTGLASDWREGREKGSLPNASCFLLPANVRVGAMLRTPHSTVFVAQRNARCSLPQLVSEWQRRHRTPLPVFRRPRSSLHLWLPALSLDPALHLASASAELHWAGEASVPTLTLSPKQSDLKKDSLLSEPLSSLSQMKSLQMWGFFTFPSCSLVFDF